MFTLAYPWLLLLLPLPALVWWFAPAHREPRQGLVVPFLARLAAESGRNPTDGAVVLRGGWLRRICMAIYWCGIILALARPQIIEPPITRDVPVRDMILAVDLSGSMKTEDFTNSAGKKVDRLTAVKEVLDDFLAHRKGDRVGLIFFGTAPFVQAPFTEDLDVCRQLLDEAQVGMAGPQTAFGDALGLAINMFDRSQVKERVLIALTDGNDTASSVPPAKAAEIARDKGIVIHTVAVGDPRAAGEDALDVDALKNVAAATGGIFAHAADHAQINGIYQKIDSLETHKAETVSHRPRRDIYWWPLAGGLLVSLLQHALQLIPGRKPAPRKGTASALATPSFASLAPLPMLAALSSTPAILHPVFHFLRPWWFVALVPAACLFWLIHRRQDAAQAWHGIVAPHLLSHLLRGQTAHKRIGPLEVIGMCWLVSILAVAGPSWRLEPSPFADDTAELAIVMKVTPSMITEDVQPSRLARSVQKIHDLLALRRGAKAALIAYSGTAHTVMPATKDDGIIYTFAQALDPKIMPVEGDSAAEALRLADQTLARAGSGSILWITDGIAPEEAAQVELWRKKSRTPVRLFAPLLEGGELSALSSATRVADASLVKLTPDDGDVNELARAAKYSAAATGAASDRWEDGGYWLTPLLGALLLPFYRQGWMAQTSAKR